MKFHAIDSFIRQLQRSHNLTLLELTVLLGYKSPTTLTRLMQETSTYESLLKFADRLRSCEGIRLSQQEYSQLYDLTELYDVGEEDYNVMLALRRLLRGEPLVTSGSLTLILPDGTKRSFLAHYGSVTLKRMLLLNCEQVALYHDLALLLENRDFAVKHLQYSGTSALHTVHSLHAARPVLYSSKYSSYSYSLTFDMLPKTHGLITSDLLICEYERDGVSCHELVVFTSPNTGQVQPIDLNLHQLRRFFPDDHQLTPVRVMLDDNSISGYYQLRTKMRTDCAVYRLRPDICLEQIPADMLLHTYRANRHDAACNDFVAMVERIRALQRKQIAYGNRICHVMKRSAMWNFVHTGRICDHMTSCRSFTIQERLDILLYIKNQLLSQSQYHIYFLKDDSVLRDDEFVLYEGEGLFVIKLDNSGNRQDMHGEIMITQPDFLKVFSRFFAESTLRYRVESTEVTVAAFDDMIEYCRSTI